ncbi:RNA polymerase subunit sigma-70 [Dehalococcoides mccartyi]|uniref:RNA polymerase sigma factor n=1 Tax=Dehalococcoides mccartyi TaxID=61435 RepID=UPI00098F0922|nr:sigma-70 region 4 domain-containing protein [Dehalococcoides mccartyi]AQU05415.1 RNA polymerase subunit sigma-70 [Dehalococcoides mccartyi]AQU06867.1 RNA polymerase subunit sigma-70 [Dehalococcoides mccartyi]
MTSPQKQRIKYLRGKGESYAAVADALGISENTVKSYCHRNNLGTGFITEQIQPINDICANCGRPLTHMTGAKKKRFCSDKCRMVWWAKHPEAVNRKAVYYFVCPTCGVEFAAYGNAKRKYCSRACFGLSRRATDE